LGLGIGAVTGADLGVLAMFGACQVGLGLTLFTVGSRLLPSAQASDEYLCSLSVHFSMHHI
jgi:hypothetical protein